MKLFFLAIALFALSLIIPARMLLPDKFVTDPLSRESDLSKLFYICTVQAFMIPYIAMFFRFLPCECKDDLGSHSLPSPPPPSFEVGLGPVFAPAIQHNKRML